MKPFYFILLITVLLYACGHTNNLGKYDLFQQTIYFEEYVEPDATRVEMSFDKDKAKDDSSSVVKGIIEGLGTSLVTFELEKKLTAAANPDSLIYNMSAEFANDLVKILRIMPARILDDKSLYVATATLKECKLTSSSFGVYINIEASFKIYERGTGSIVWENTESKSAPIKRLVNIQGGDAGAAIKNVAQLAELSALSEEQLRRIINQSAREVAQLMFETFREDLIKSSQDKQ